MDRKIQLRSPVGNRATGHRGEQTNPNPFTTEDTEDAEIAEYLRDGETPIEGPRKSFCEGRYTAPPTLASERRNAFYEVVKEPYSKPVAPGGSAGVDAPAQSPGCAVSDSRIASG